MQMQTQKIIMATGNMGKVLELRELLRDLPVEVMTAREAGFGGTVEETGSTFAANAILKAEAVCQALDQWALADDSGLEVDALGGAPGVYSARYAGEDANDAANNRKLLQALAGVNDRGGRFVSEVALARPGKPTITFRGECAGVIATEPAGQGGFGYDPLFVVPDYGQTYAELPLTIKNQISHRGKAMQKLIDYLRQELGQV